MSKKLKPIHPGEMLREEFMIPLGLSSSALQPQLFEHNGPRAEIMNTLWGFGAQGVSEGNAAVVEMAHLGGRHAVFAGAGAAGEGDEAEVRRRAHFIARQFALRFSTERLPQTCEGVSYEGRECGSLGGAGGDGARFYLVAAAIWSACRAWIALTASGLQRFVVHALHDPHSRSWLSRTLTDRQ